MPDDENKVKLIRRRESVRTKQVGGTIQKSVGEHFTLYINDLIDSGRYQSVAEVLRAALRLHEREFGPEKTPRSTTGEA